MWTPCFNEGKKETKQRDREKENFVCNSEALRVEVGANLLQDCLMVMLRSNLTQICCQCLLLQMWFVSGVWMSGLLQRREGGCWGTEEGLYILSTHINNVHNTDDWGNMLCHTVTVENKCINSCFVYRGCQPNCYGQGPRVSGMGTPAAVVVAHVVWPKLSVT